MKSVCAQPSAHRKGGGDRRHFNRGVRLTTAHRVRRADSRAGRAYPARGRAARRRTPSDTAFPHRTAGFGVLILAQWQDPAATDANIAWARDTNARLMPHAVTGGYSNYLVDDEPLGRIRQAYAGNFERLQRLKDRSDPASVFHLNQNILPSSRRG